MQRERGLTDAAAQQLATELCTRAIQARVDAMFETVMSQPSELAELQRARAHGHHVAARVAAGGHDVPHDRIRARYERTLALAPVAIGLADQAVVFDNMPSGFRRP